MFSNVFTAKDARQSYECDQCEKSYYSKNGLANHVNLSHLGDIPERKYVQIKKIYLTLIFLLSKDFCVPNVEKVLRPVNDYDCTNRRIRENEISNVMCVVSIEK